MIEHKDDVATPVNGRPALPQAPERKELPPAPNDAGGEREYKVVDPPPAPPRRRSHAWIWLLLLAIAGFIGWRSYQNVQKKNAEAAAAQGRRAANRGIPVAGPT